MFYKNCRAEKIKNGKIKKGVLWVLTFSLLFSLAGCGKSAEEGIVGKWSWSAEDGATIEFTENGTMIAKAGGWTSSGKYKIEGDKLILEVIEDGESEIMIYSKLKIDENNFTVYDDYDDCVITGHRVK